MLTSARVMRRLSGSPRLPARAPGPTSVAGHWTGLPGLSAEQGPWTLGSRGRFLASLGKGWATCVSSGLSLLYSNLTYISFLYLDPFSVSFLRISECCPAVLFLFPILFAIRRDGHGDPVGRGMALWLWA